jgi:hypothetical protein
MVVEVELSKIASRLLHFHFSYHKQAVLEFGVYTKIRRHVNMSSTNLFILTFSQLVIKKKIHQSVNQSINTIQK